MGLSSQLIRRGPLTIAIGGARGNTLELRGIMREPEVASWLGPLIERVHREAVSQGLQEVVLDLRALEYTNATLWKSLAVWLRMVREDPRARYVLRLLSDSARSWQRVGVPMLRIFGGSKLVVEER